MNIFVADYDRTWPDRFERESERIARILGENLVRIFHIGSTSVPGLMAKPVIDIMPVVNNVSSVDHLQEDFCQLGYEYMGEFGIPGRRYLKKGGDNRTHHIHIFQYDNTADILRHLVFRNYLRCHKDVCDNYSAIKKNLARDFPKDLDGYCMGKDSFVKQVEKDALRWYWESVS